MTNLGSVFKRLLRSAAAVGSHEGPVKTPTLPSKPLFRCGTASFCADCGNGCGDSISYVGAGSDIVSLLSLANGDKAKIAFVRGDHQALRTFFQLGLKPGTEIVDLGKIADARSVAILVTGETMNVPNEIASNVFVRIF